ncbi:MAG: HypC/HybG/HupF family hydrogenase formation chaperone [Gammaproteobacteria bacterium]|nr:HypC/HybG/HupF family hydrogenase formation chaperone [Gammaproteobacteria bacterium]MBU1724644.1 HypC/HybG/HupF family hydrogenase formation chaperone [Gammaproteobacteria bacterium]MBU2005338.1 HypC/HybG/HupF family hydrogenase formation chaperone [Gammaproteobacteria bacterium]
MCLAIPMQIIAIDGSGLSARCEARGIEREAGLLMMQGETLAVGDYVMISLGQVMQKVSAEEAALAWQHYDEIFAVLDS